MRWPQPAALERRLLLCPPIKQPHSCCNAPPTCFMKSATSARTKLATPVSPFSPAFCPASSTAAAEESTPSAAAAPPAAALSAKPPE